MHHPSNYPWTLFTSQDGEGVGWWVWKGRPKLTIYTSFCNDALIIILPGLANSCSWSISIVFNDIMASLIVIVMSVVEYWSKIKRWKHIWCLLVIVVLGFVAEGLLSVTAVSHKNILVIRARKYFVCVCELSWEKNNKYFQDLMSAVYLVTLDKRFWLSLELIALASLWRTSLKMFSVQDYFLTVRFRQFGGC